MIREMREGAGHEQDARRADGAPSHCAPKYVACVELFTTAALALSTAVAVTAVSIGMARAEVIGAVGKGDGAPFAIALTIGLLVTAMASLTAAVVAQTRE